VEGVKIKDFTGGGASSSRQLDLSLHFEGGEDSCTAAS
jgi:hypothetical protein